MKKKRKVRKQMKKLIIAEEKKVFAEKEASDPNESPSCSRVGALVVQSLGEIEQKEESPYNPEFVKEILEAEKSIKDGKGTRMTMDELKELCK